MFKDHASAARSFGTWRSPRPASLVNWLVALDARHRQRLALARLDDRLLGDVGLSRRDVAAEIEKPVLPHGPF